MTRRKDARHELAGDRSELPRAGLELIEGRSTLLDVGTRDLFDLFQGSLVAAAARPPARIVVCSGRNE